MTDIVEQAARKVFEHQIPLASDKPRDFDDPKFLYERNKAFDTAQALADAGLLAEPARTVPTREQIARALSTHHYSIAYGGCACGADFEDETETLEAEQEAYNQHAADAVLALLNGQPTVAEVQAQALEEAAAEIKAQTLEEVAHVLAEQEHFTKRAQGAKELKKPRPTDQGREMSDPTHHPRHSKITTEDTAK